MSDRRRAVMELRSRLKRAERIYSPELGGDLLTLIDGLHDVEDRVDALERRTPEFYADRRLELHMTPIERALTRLETECKGRNESQGWFNREHARRVLTELVDAALKRGC